MNWRPRERSSFRKPIPKSRRNYDRIPLYRGDLVEAVEKAIQRIEGTFAFAVISEDHPGLIVGARRGSPLAAGLGENGEALLASDAIPLIQYTRRIVYLNDGQVLVLRLNELSVRENGQAVEFKTQTVTWSNEETERGGYAHYMLKEIHEQPGALRRLAFNLVAHPGSANSAEPEAPVFNLDRMPLDREYVRSISRIVLVGQGTAFHAGLVARNMIERCARIPAYAEYGSDFRYRDPIIDDKVLVIAVSQSGETADTLGAVRIARERGCRAISVINTVDSTIARESDGVIYMGIGPEIGVASTKAFTGQIAALLRAGAATGNAARNPHVC